MSIARVLTAAVAVAALAACSSSGGRAASRTTAAAAAAAAAPSATIVGPTLPHSASQAQLASVLVTSDDLGLPDTWLPADPETGLTTADTGDASALTCPGVGVIKDSQTVGDPMAQITFTNTDNSSLDETIENATSPAAAMDDFNKGVALLASCPSVTLSGSTFTVTRLTLPAIGDARAAYSFTGTINGKKLTVGTAICIVGSNEISFSEINESSLDANLAVTSLTEGVKKLAHL